MSGVYVYCVVPAGAAPADRTGIDGQTVVAIETDGLAAWYSEHDAKPAAGVERIRQHDAVVSAALAHGTTPVPFRFGQWLADTAELEERLRGRADAWRALLAEFEGACEMGVRATWPEPAAAREMHQPQQSGRAYLEQIARRHGRTAELRARSERIAGTVRAALAGLALRERVDHGAGAAVSMAHLVRRPDTGRYRAALDAVSRAYPDLALHVSGPWPPYSFVR